jgi:hypothetical protein
MIVARRLQRSFADGLIMEEVKDLCGRLDGGRR